VAELGRSDERFHAACEPAHAAYRPGPWGRWQARQSRPLALVRPTDHCPRGRSPG